MSSPHRSTPAMLTRDQAVERLRNDLELTRLQESTVAAGRKTLRDFVVGVVPALVLPRYSCTTAGLGRTPRAKSNRHVKVRSL